MTPAATPPPALRPWPLPLWIAHRGAGRLAPENTLAAFRVGAGYGYRAFECDVKLSADGQPFLLHDTTLDRTTSGRGVAGERPWAELARMDAGGWHSRGYAGEPLPHLDAIARFVQRNGYALNLEIKPTPGLEQATGAAVGAACLRLFRQAATPLLFSSFRPEALQGAQGAAPGIPRALLLDRLWPGWLDVARALDCVAVVTDYALMDAPLIAQLRGAGLRALCYTVNDPAEAWRLQALGIDGLITDAVDRFSPHAGSGVFD
ncbi:MAG: glycerophosphodiester phosphodiesterase [Burkholderiales bacterium]|nr:glycerophosphodiester phosphodiesterase [Burkholderiales bacterium]